MAVVLVVLLAVGAGLWLAGGDDDDDGGGDVGAGAGADGIAVVCRRSNEEIATAQSALLRDNPAPEAPAEFLGDAFVDLTRDRSAAIRALAPSPEVVAVLDDFDAVVDAIEADPTIGLGADPFEAVDDRWVELGLPDCAIGAGTVADG